MAAGRPIFTQRAVTESPLVLSPVPPQRPYYDRSYPQATKIPVQRAPHTRQAYLKGEHLVLHRPRNNEPLNADFVQLAQAMDAVDRLLFDRGVPGMRVGIDGERGAQGELERLTAISGM